MSRNTKKIRREVTIDGAKKWITADTEQEYAEKLLRFSANFETAHKHLFRDYAEFWFQSYAQPNIATVTAINYERQLRVHIFPVIGDLYLEDVDVLAIQQIFNQMGADVKQDTKHRVKNVLNQIFKMAVEEGLIRRNPILSPSLKVKGLPAMITEPYSVEEMRYFVAHLDDLSNPYDRAWLAINSCLPLRPEETLGIRWADINERDLTIHIRNTITHPDRNQPVFHTYTKTAASNRILALPKSLLQYLPEHENLLDYVIGGAEPLSYTRLRRMCQRIANEIGYDGTITPRRFRTTVATDISATTHDLKLVQRMLGHSTPQMTLKHYDKGRNTAADGAEAIEKCYGF